VTDPPAARYDVSVRRHRPVTTFLALALGLGWVLLSIPAVVGLPNEPFLVLLVYVALVGSALLVTRWVEGPGGVRLLLSRALIWRFGVVRWLVILFAIPVLTLAFAAVSRTLVAPESGWWAEVGGYLFATLVFGAVLFNVWEELAWAGFMQSRLMARHGLLVGALVTAPFFAAIHIPLQFEDGWTWSEIWLGLVILFALAPFYRYLLGMHLLDTRGSLLAVGIQHASWNAAINLDSVDGDWQTMAAVVLTTLLVAGGRRLWHPEAHPTGREVEKLTAARWFTDTEPPPRAADLA
jgi:membrane protease YdiL (CAAX protease family)